MDAAASSGNGGFGFSGQSASQGYAIPIENALTIATKIVTGDDGTNIHLGANRGLLGVEIQPDSGVSNSGAVVNGVQSGLRSRTGRHHTRRHHQRNRRKEHRLRISTHPRADRLLTQGHRPDHLDRLLRIDPPRIGPPQLRPTRLTKTSEHTERRAERRSAKDVKLRCGAGARRDLRSGRRRPSASWRTRVDVAPTARRGGPLETSANGAMANRGAYRFYSWSPRGLEASQDLVEVVVRADQFGQCDGILDGHGGTLSQNRWEGMGRVADEHHAALVIGGGFHLVHGDEHDASWVSLLLDQS